MGIRERAAGGSVVIRRGVLAILTIAAAAFTPAAAQAAVDDTIMVSLADPGAPVPGAQGNGVSQAPSISDDGCEIAFESFATNLTGDNYTGANPAQIFVRHVCGPLAGTTELVSRATGAGAPQNNPTPAGTTTPAISGDGTKVVWVTASNNLDPLNRDTQGTPVSSIYELYDVYMRDLSADTTTLISVNHLGDDSVGYAEPVLGFDLSEHGEYVAWQSAAAASTIVLGATDTNQAGYQTDVFRYDTSDVDQVNANILISRTNDNMSVTTGNGGSFNPSISATGSRVSFDGNSSNFDPPKNNGPDDSDVFVRDITAGSTTLVSETTGGTHGNGPSYRSRISPNGNTVLFLSNAVNLGARGGIGDGSADVFVHDISPAKTEQINRVSGEDGQVQQSGGANTGGLSTDGRLVAFGASADLVDGPPGGVYVRDRLNQTTFVADRGTGVTGEPANGGSSQGQMSANGRYVTFWSTATNLVPVDINGTDDVFRREIAEPPEVNSGLAVNIRPTAGTILAAEPGGGFAPVEHSDQVPIDTVIDATAGRVELTADNVLKDSMRFFGGQFSVRQALGEGQTTLDVPAATGCPPVVAPSTGKKKKKKKKKKGRIASVRAGGGSLFGSGKGRFRTRGGRGAATVRGTDWFTQETCAGTLFRLDSGGPLEIDDFGLAAGIDAVLTAPGSTYLAAPPVAPKTCRKGFKLKNGKCVKRKKKKKR